MKKILVIEDETPVRSSIVDLLEAEDYEALSAENGFIGLRMAQEQLPDLIICDVMMPEMDGYEVLSSLQQDPATAVIPFIFLTAKAAKSDQREGMNLGADDYLTKPFTRAELLQTLTARLGKRQAVTRLSEQKLGGIRNSITHVLPSKIIEPLDAIAKTSQQLMQDSHTVQPADIHELAQQIQTAAHFVQKVIENFFVYTQIEFLAQDSEEVKMLKTMQTANPEEIIRTVVAQTAESRDRELNLNFATTHVALKMPSGDFTKVVEELVDNAFQFSPPQTTIRIKTTVENQLFHLYVMNDGEPMRPELIDSIMSSVSVENQFYEQPDLGLGLIIAKRLTELYGGYLTLTSTLDSQTQVCATFRLADAESSV